MTKLLSNYDHSNKNYQYFLHNHTFKEIAEVLDMLLGTAKSVLYRRLVGSNICMLEDSVAKSRWKMKEL